MAGDEGEDVFDTRSPPAPGRYRRLRASMGRHPADLARMAVAAGVVLLGVWIASAPGLNPVESAIYGQLQELPPASLRAWQVVSWAGWWPGIVAAGALALYAGWIRMGVSVVATAVSAWLLVLLLHAVTVPRLVSPDVLLASPRGPGAGGFDFPSLRTAVVAALATAAGPYLARRSRQATWVLVVLVGVSQVFLGHSLPVGAFAGAVLGWGVGNLFHLLLAAPGRRTSEDSVRMALADVGISCAELRPVGRGMLRPLEYDVTEGSGDHLRLKVLRRMHRRAGPAYRLRRFLASVDAGAEPSLSTPAHEVEHEAYITLLAQRAGIGTVPVLLTGKIEHGPPFLLRRHVQGRRLSSLAGEAVADETLARIWADVAALASHHLSHHDLRARNILIDGTGRPLITDFTFSTVGGPPRQAPQDVADTLVSLASVVGSDRAVDSAVRAVPPQALEAALPHLQWLSLHRRLRRQLGPGPESLADLRETLAERIGCAPPSFRSPVRPVTLAIMVAVGLAVYLLLPQLSSMGSVLAALRRADSRWIAVTLVAGLLGVLASSLTILGASPCRLPFWKTLAVQLAAAFTGRTTAGGVGFYGVNIVYLERLGLRRSRAVGVIVLNRAAVGLVTGVATVVGILVIGNAVPVGDIHLPRTGLVLLVGAAVCVAATALLASPVGRRRVLRPGVQLVRELAQDLLPTLRRPASALQLIGGSLAFLVLGGIGLAASLAAFEAHVRLVDVLAVYVVGSTLGQLVPTPGGLGAVEAATIAGLTAVGVSSTDAVTAVLISRAVSFWLPAVPGLVAFRLLQHHGIV